GEALEGERANLFGYDASLEGDINALTEQNLAVLGLGAEPRCDVAHRANGGIAGALREADLAERRIPLRDAAAEAEVATPLAPGGNQRTRGLAHRHRHVDGALGRVGDRQRVVEEHHDAVARELIERALELADKRAQRAMVFAQEIEDFLGLRGFG